MGHDLEVRYFGSSTGDRATCPRTNSASSSYQRQWSASS